MNINKFNKINLIKFILILIGLTIIFSYSAHEAAAASGNTIYVNGSSGNDANNGYTWKTAKLTINNATDTVSSGGTVKIANGVYNENDITINKNMTITGLDQNKTIINGTNTNTIFIIPSGVNVVISKLTLTNGGDSSNHGAIENNGTITVKNCRFTSNNATFGGAIYNEGTATVKNCDFTGNSALIGGAIYNLAVLTVQNSIFLNNSDFVTISGGGAIHNQGTLTVSGSSFTGNNAYNGGAICNWAGNSTVTSSTFNNNIADSNGGAINNEAILKVTGCIFTDNTATGIGSWGGAISNDGTMTVNNSKFNNNTALDFGGAICNWRTLTVKNSTFTNNKTTSEGCDGEGGAIYNYGLSLDVTGCNFTDNYAYQGGAILNQGNATVNRSNFTGNTAMIGGAVFNQIDYCTITLKNCTFTDNNLTAMPGSFGGAVFNGFLSTMNATGCTFTGNQASEYGGAIYNEGTATVHFNRIVGNNANIGSAIYNYIDGIMDATLNWWGTNDGNVIANQISNDYGGSLTYNPWIILTITASPINVKVGGTSKITAELLYDSSGTYHNPTNGLVPYTGSADFKSTKGTIINSNFSNGKAKSILTSLIMPGVVIVSATVDGVTVTKTVTIK
jgi:autotransporter family porin